MKKYLLALMSVTLLNGCATAFTGTNQAINVNVKDQNQNQLEDAHCTLIDSYGADYHLSSAPGTVIIPKGRAPLHIECKEAGFTPYSGSINSHFNPITLLDVFFWPTFIVDFATGAAQQYPGHYTVMMSKKA